jgi:hypothetical protein
MCLLSPDFAYRTVLADRGDDLVIVVPAIRPSSMLKSRPPPNSPSRPSFRVGRATQRPVGHLPWQFALDDSVFDYAYTPSSG